MQDLTGAILIIVLGGGTFIGFIANASEMILLQREVKQRRKKQNIVVGIFSFVLSVQII
ncbi:hypothetical protein [Desulfobacula sp.]|uniref:hypothetical protein n=1 Tax=Desulfobacula sp. TaxID=2593537 RepID=UPI0026018272|nr:hypothetical protein [Desulfobacula sp.]